MKKDIGWGISGTKERIFVSSAFGCCYNCTYCYLHELVETGKYQQFSTNDLLKELKRSNLFIPGKGGSLITIGCFTECFDKKNKETTINMINFFLKNGNYIQVSTKKRIDNLDIARMLSNIQFENQINFFVSIPTLSYAERYEPDADSPEIRISNLELKNIYGINTYLYIKPVIENITLKDKNKYIEIIEKYHVPVIIGGTLHIVSKQNNQTIEIGNATMQEYCNDDSYKLEEIFKKYTTVFRHSYDAIQR